MRVLLPPALTSLFPGSPSSIEIEAETVDALFNALDLRWPGMRDRLCDSTPRIRRHVNVFLGGERATLGSRVTGQDEVVIMTAISGG